MDWKKLQNGSDIRGVALDGIEGENVNLTPDVSNKLARVFIKWMQKRIGKENITLAIGVDSRISGPALKNSFIDGCIATGMKIYDCGLASTPAMFMTTVDKDINVDAGVMVTASHLPFNRNGLKFFTSEGGLEKEDIAALLTMAADNDIACGNKKGEVEKLDFMTKYSSSLVDFIREGVSSSVNYDKPLTGMHIIVDAGNGGGGFFAKVLEVLGADVKGSQFLNPDGRFPNHIPNPENKEAMQSICDAVVKSKSDLGIIFDTDVDRSAIVDREGDPINRNSLIALIAAVILKEHPGSTVVTDSVTSDGLAEFISSRGGKHHRFRRGYKNVINEGIRLNKNGEECWLAIETSGHAALRENYFLDDGAYLVAKLLIDAAKLKQEGKELQSLIADMKQPAESKEIRFTINTDNFKEYGQSVLDDFSSVVETIDGWKKVTPNHEGIRVSCSSADQQGWFLLRLSLHDPVMPLNIESNINGGVENIERKLMQLINKYDKLVK